MHAHSHTCSPCTPSPAAFPGICSLRASWLSRLLVGSGPLGPSAALELGAALAAGAVLLAAPVLRGEPAAASAGLGDAASACPRHPHWGRGAPVGGSPPESPSPRLRPPFLASHGGTGSLGSGTGARPSSPGPRPLASLGPRWSFPRARGAPWPVANTGLLADMCWQLWEDRSGGGRNGC